MEVGWGRLGISVAGRRGDRAGTVWASVGSCLGIGAGRLGCRLERGASVWSFRGHRRGTCRTLIRFVSVSVASAGGIGLGNFMFRFE
eukprot:7654100-Pyramimonas_sp.AAC.1